MMHKGNFPNLQRLMIFSGWTVTYNGFINIDPLNLDANDSKWFSFTEDLLQLTHIRSDIIVDLGWYPEMNPNGEYKVSVVKDKNWEEPIISFRSRNKDDIVMKIEKILFEVVTNGKNISF
jgi:hypothetical protein